MAEPESKPVRVQLSRKKGWRLPPGTVTVARPGRFGNPFAVGKLGPMDRLASDREGAVGFFRAMLADPEMRAAAGYPSDAEIRSALAGHNLACWCPLGAPCHADVLLDIANVPDSGGRR
jgi:hypothetical protein